MENARKDFDESANFDVVSDIDAVIDGIGKEYDKRLIDLTKERTRVLQAARRLAESEQSKNTAVFEAIRKAYPDNEDFKRISATQIEVVERLYEVGLLKEVKS